MPTMFGKWSNKVVSIRENFSRNSYNQSNHFQHPFFSWWNWDMDSGDSDFSVNCALSTSLAIMRRPTAAEGRILSWRQQNVCIHCPQLTSGNFRHLQAALDTVQGLRVFISVRFGTSLSFAPKFAAQCIGSGSLVQLIGFPCSCKQSFQCVLQASQGRFHKTAQPSTLLWI